MVGERCSGYRVESVIGYGGLDFENLLFAHGEPLTGNGKSALREFVEG
jgi:hypothetical protein